MTRTNLLSAILISAILFPWIAIGMDFPQLRPEWFLLLAGIIIFPPRTQYINVHVIWLTIGVIACYLLSIAVGVLLLNIPPALKDLTEVLKPVLYTMLYVFIASEYYEQEDFLTLMRIIILTLVIACLITIIQYFNADSIASLLYLYRQDPEELEAYKQLRSWGTMGNPNDMGLLAAIGFAVVLFSHTLKIFQNKFQWTFLLITFGAVLATGSRTGMVILLAIIAYYLVVQRKAKIIPLAIASGIAVVGFFVFGALATLVGFEGVNQRILSLIEFNEDLAWLERVEVWDSVLPLILTDTIFFGHGPAKSEFLSIGNSDNEYLILVFRYGLVGALVTAAFIWTLAIGIAKPATDLQRTMKNLAAALLLAGALFAFTAGTFGQFRIMFVLILLWALPVNVRSSKNTQPQPLG